MALKDLVAPKSALTEAAIEEVVSEYIRYDPESKEVHFLPAAAGLSGKSRVLVYLVALQGWPFVTSDPVITEARPADLESRLHIPGGTLRPMLKALKERHLIAAGSEGYTVRPAALPAIKVELSSAGQGTGDRPRRSPRPRRRTTGDEAPAVTSKSSRRPKGSPLADRFDQWIEDGFFDDPKTLADVQRKFHKEGFVLPQTSIPKYLLRALHGNRLTRDEAAINNKKVWVYQRKT